MNKGIIILGFIAIFWGVACSSDSEEELFERSDCQTPVSLEEDVLPVLQVNCAVEGCHVAGTGLPNFQMKENVLTHADQIKRLVLNGTMPPSGSGIELSQEEITTLTCWVDQGKKDN